MNCERCEEKEAEFNCDDCGSKFCQSCNTDIHQKGKWQAHVRTPLPKSAPVVAAVEEKKCERCEEKGANFSCEECGSQFCATCDQEVHLKGKWQTHVRTPLGGSGGSTPAPAQTPSTPSKPNPTPAPAPAPTRTGGVMAASQRFAPTQSQPQTQTQQPTPGRPSVNVSQRPPVSATPAQAPKPATGVPPIQPKPTSTTGAPPPSIKPAVNASVKAPTQQQPQAKKETISTKLDSFERQFTSQKLLSNADPSELDSATQQLLQMFADRSDDDLKGELKELEGKRLIELVGSLTAVLSRV